MAKWYDTLDELVVAETDPKNYKTKALTLFLDRFKTNDIGVRLVNSLNSFTSNNILDY